MVSCLSSMHQVLGSSPSTVEEKNLKTHEGKEKIKNHHEEIRLCKQACKKTQRTVTVGY